MVRPPCAVMHRARRGKAGPPIRETTARRAGSARNRWTGVVTPPPEARTWDAGEKNLLRAAHDAGFGSYAQFHRLVRATTGRTPRALLDPGARAALVQAVLPGW